MRLNEQVHYNLFTPKVLPLEQVIETQDFEFPTFQREYIWDAKRMLNLIDSVYRGIPINSIYTWRTEGIPIKGQSNLKSNNEMVLVIDGQQRIKALKGMLLGQTYRETGGKKVAIRVAFNPIKGTFQKIDGTKKVADDWIESIASFYNSPEAETSIYFERNKGQLSDDATQTAKIHLKQLASIKRFPIVVYEINDTADLEQVFLCFDRTNSGGQPIKQGELCVAWLEAYQPLLAETIVLFSQELQPRVKIRREPTRNFEKSMFSKAVEWIPLRSNASPCHYRPKPEHVADLLFNVVQGGKQFKLGKIASELLSPNGTNGQENPNVPIVQDALLAIVNGENYERFNQILGKLAGIDQTEKNYAYWLYLGCRNGSVTGVESRKYNFLQITQMLQRWYLLQLLNSVKVSGSLAFSKYMKEFHRNGGLVGYMEEMEKTLPLAFWDEKLPEALAKPAKQSASKLQKAWEMTQILRKEAALFDDGVLIQELQGSKLRSVHHIYPRDYLKRKKYPATHMNAIANLALTTGEVNSRIGSKQLNRFIEERQELDELQNAAEHLVTHCIPETINKLTYEEFLDARAKAMASRIKKVYENLKV